MTVKELRAALKIYQIKGGIYMTRNEIMNSVLEEIGSYSDENETGEIVREFSQLYEDFRNMMIKVGYTIDEGL